MLVPDLEKRGKRLIPSAELSIRLCQRITEKYLPLKSGAMFHAETPPCFMNWPSAISRKKTGIPPMNTISK